MAGNADNADAFVEIWLKDLGIQHFMAFEDLLFAHGDAFEPFDHQVCQGVVEFHHDGLQFLFAFFRERTPEVLHHHLYSVGKQAINNKKEKVGKQVSDPEWNDSHQKGNSADKEVGEVLQGNELRGKNRDKFDSGHLPVAFGTTSQKIS